ncbi:MAG: molybdopterin oxidoreductase family protein [Anaerolineae bacterium]
MAMILSDSDLRVVHAVCPHDCPDTCGMKVTVREGRAVKIEGDPTHPTTRGFLCGKVGQHYLDMIYSPRRVLTPRRRVGPKGSGLFEDITWDEAIAEIVERFQGIIAAHGAEAILPYSYSGTLGLLNEGSMDRRFFHRLGASQLERTICSEAGFTAWKYTYGASLGTDPEAFAHAKLILVWGSNPATSNTHLMPFITAARKAGARLIVIDPRQTRTARLADWHIAPRPGTDAALALALMNIIITENRHDQAWLDEHAVGFDALKARAAEWPVERAAATTGIPAEDILALAREYAATRPSVIRLNYGLQRHTNGGMMVRAVACLPAIVGAWRDLGGGALLSTSGAFPLDLAALNRPDLMPTPEPRWVNMNQLGDALLTLNDPPIEALFVYDANPAASTPNSARVIAGLMREDLFTVVHDPYFTDTTDYADIVLPATTQLEHTDLHKAYGTYYLQINQPSIAPLGESVSNVETFRRLAKAMGFTEPCFDDTVEDMIDQALARPHAHLQGITRERLMAEGWARLALPTAETVAAADIPDAPPTGAPSHTPWAPFANGRIPTPSGKVELYSERMAAAGLDPLPRHDPIAESAEADPALAARYPIHLITPSAHFFLNTSFSHVDALIAKQKDPFIELSADDAGARGIADGDWCRVFNDRGEVRLRARVGSAVRRGVAASEAIWWSKLSPEGKGINQLTSDALTDMGRGATFYTNLVQVERA